MFESKQRIRDLFMNSFILNKSIIVSHKAYL